MAGQSGAETIRVKIRDGIVELREVIDFFKRSEAALWSTANNLKQEDKFDELVSGIFEAREDYVVRLNKIEPDTLIDISERLGVWVLQHYPHKSITPETAWDRLILNSYFQLAGFLGVEPVREE